MGAWWSTPGSRLPTRPSSRCAPCGYPDRDRWAGPPAGSAVGLGVAALGQPRGVDGGFGAPVHAELEQQVRHVVLDRLLGHVQLLGDLTVRHTLREVTEDLLLLR